jgi:hypothetical protein
VSTKTSYEWRRQLMWGLLLIGFGTAVLLERLDLIDLDDIWHYWPLLLVVFGINKMIGFPTARDFTSGLWLVFLGGWLFATFEGLFGLRWHNSWPFLIIALGVTIILEPLIKMRFPEKTEPDHEK